LLCSIVSGVSGLHRKDHDPLGFLAEYVLPHLSGLATLGRTRPSGQGAPRRKTAGRFAARRQRTGGARCEAVRGLRGDGDATRFGPLALRQRHLEYAVYEARRYLIAVEVLGVSEREAAQIVADFVLGVDWRQTLVRLR
jgi:hypothetical protein